MASEIENHGHKLLDISTRRLLTSFYNGETLPSPCYPSYTQRSSTAFLLCKESLCRGAIHLSSREHPDSL
jgi:hypothetical protein